MADSDRRKEGRRDRDATEKIARQEDEEGGEAPLGPLLQFSRHILALSARLPCRVGATDAPLGSGQLTAWHLRVDSTRSGAADDDARADAARLRRRVLKSPPPGPPSARNNHEGIWSAGTEVAGPRAAWAKAEVA